MKNYLTDRKQRCNVVNCFSIWRTIMPGVLQGSILGPLSFNIFVNDIFLFAKTSALLIFADDNTQFSCEKTFDQVINNLQIDFRTLKVWLYHNFLALNLKRCFLWLLEIGANKENNLDFSITSLIYVKLQIKNWMLHSNYRLVWTQVNVACRLILLLNLTSFIVRLFGCSAIEKA